MKKLFASVFAFLILLSQFVYPVYAQNEFSSDITVTYTIGESGATTIDYDITLTNEFSSLYATAYTLNLSGLTPQNPRAIVNGRETSVEVKKSSETTSLRVTFPDQLVGKGKQRQFSVIFEEKSLVTKTGEVWEMSIPKLSNPEEFKSYRVRLKVAPSLGELAYVSPEPNETASDSQYKIYSFEKNKVAKSGVTAAFGQFQVFTFDLTYHLENPLNKPALVEIAIPPDSAYQKVNYTSLTPLPETVDVDPDGNWLALYKLKPRERVDVEAAGAVQIFAGSRYQEFLSEEERKSNLASSPVWQTDSPIVQNLTKSLRTPEEIYRYVASTLKYDYERVQPNVDRLGAEKALQNPQSAICMEFTDAFIALARAAGIPAREVNGYAYTENPELQPLSLVADVLHSWPEYWNEEKRVWVPVDPTWENTSGIDYFSKLDLRHFTFVIHGKDAFKPYPPGSYKLGSLPQKDVFVSFGKLPEKRVAEPEITLTTYQDIPFISMKSTTKIRNPGPTSIENQYLEIYFDERNIRREKITLLPPFSYRVFETKIPFTILGQKTPSKVTVNFAGQSTTAATNRDTVIIVSLATILIAIFSVILYLFIKTKANERIRKLLSKKTDG